MLAQLGLCLPIWRPGMSAAETKTHHTTMSEYQYFEFQALDRPLTREQMDELRRHSTRARITATGFVNEYHYGDFKGSPERWMAAFFDAFVHLTNWGTRWLMLRLPRALFTAEHLSAYCTPGEALTYREEGDHIVLSFYASSEDHDWVEGEGWLATLTPLRSALLGGDERCLYLGWLLGVQVGEVDDEDGEPPVPPGLGALDEPLRALVDFFGLDADLIAVAAEHSGPLEARPLSTEALARWVEDLAAADKDALLVSLLSEGNGYQPQHELQLLRRRARREIEATTSPANSTTAAVPRRTAGELLARAEALTESRRREQAARQAREAAEREAEAAKRRKLRLHALMGEEERLWQEVDQLIATRQPKSYDRAVSLLKDLRDLAAVGGAAEAFTRRMRDLAARHMKKPSLIRRFRSAALVP
jgi:hypothetical protein